MSKILKNFLKALWDHVFNVIDLIVLFDLFLIFNWGNGGFTTKRFYLFLPGVFDMIIIYAIIRVYSNLARLMVKSMKEGNKE